MRRSAALRGLSSDHHAGLVLARRARNAAGAGAQAQAAAWRDVTERFRTELEPHFEVEERELLPALRSAGETALVVRTSAEHRALRAFVHAGDPANLLPFAEALEAHIRFEETQLFEVAQQVLAPEVLAGLERE
jgi:hemerythrin-like domain-containing protein